MSLDGQTEEEHLRAYIERAYMAVDGESDKNKVELALKQRLMPLLQSGEAWRLEWLTEPLPTDPGFDGNFNKPKAAPPPIGGSFWTPLGMAGQPPGPRGGRARGRGGGVRGRNVFGGGGGRGPWGRSSSSSSSDSDRRRSPKRSRRSRSPSPRRRWRSPTPEDDDPLPKAFGGGKKKRGNTQNKRGGKRGAKNKQPARWEMAESEDNRRRRAERFRPQPKVASSRIYNQAERVDIDDILSLDYGTSSTDLYLHQGTVVGTSEELEKPFFRLTSAADPTDVRPERVLRRSLDMVKRRWRDERQYVFAQSQLRSIRQDLTVQRIRNAFTIEAYETHARIALEQGDREEFNKCQTQLKTLYREIPGSENEFEFTAYRLLYYISMSNDLDITTLLSELTVEAKTDPTVKFARDIRRFWALGLYSNLLQAYSRAPGMSAYVMDLFVERERRAALRVMLKAYRPSIPVAVVLERLGFGAGEEEDGRAFLAELDVLKDGEEDAEKIDTRQAFAF